MAQPRIGLLLVDLGGLDQAVDLGTGGGALAPDDKRLDRSFGVTPTHRLTLGGCLGKAAFSSR
ncbi:hypothetical protein D3C81_1986510 [compost metagenome]